MTINDRVSSRVVIEKLNDKNTKELVQKNIEQLSPYQQDIKQVEDILNNRPRKN